MLIMNNKPVKCDMAKRSDALSKKLQSACRRRLDAKNKANRANKETK